LYVFVVVSGRKVVVLKYAVVVVVVLKYAGLVVVLERLVLVPVVL